MEKAITIKRLALENIRRKPFRTAALITLTSLFAAVLFGSLIITSSLKGGIKGFKNRLGADLMIVPKGYEGQMENILLNGEPNYFYMDKSAEEIVRTVQGVKEASGQFYLTSLSESCCDFPIQIIGFEPDTDFLIQNWAKTKVRPQKGSEYSDSSVSRLRQQPQRRPDGNAVSDRTNPWHGQTQRSPPRVPWKQDRRISNDRTFHRRGSTRRRVGSAGSGCAES